jgi:ADP-heptose:LPS heptosyltransferase
MNVNLQRTIDRVAGVWICRLLSLFASNSTDSMRAEPVRILVILLSERGSLVLAYPMFARLRRKYPEASLHALVFRQNREVLDLLDIVPDANVFTVCNDSFVELVRTSIGALREIRRRRIDTAIDCELFARIGSILSLLSGARIRVGFHPHTQEGLYRGSHINRPVLYSPYVHMSQQFLNMAEAIDADGFPLVKRRIDKEPMMIPALNAGADEIERARRRLETDFSGIDAGKLVLIYPGGGLLPIRAWPLENYAEVARRLIGAGWSVAVIGLAEDRGLAEWIREQVHDSRLVDLTGYTRSVRDLMILFHFAALLITNDGGPGHFAAMTPIETIVLYGPETPMLYGALHAGACNLFAGLSCSACLTAYNHRNSPCNGDNACLKAIRTQEVLDAAFARLRQKS